MSSKILIFPLVLALTLHGLTMQITTSRAIGKAPVVHITNAIAANNTPPVEMQIEILGGDLLPSISLSRGQEYQLKAIEDSSYTAVAFHGEEFATFDPYSSERDKGRAAVYWKVDDVGFYIGYDGLKWKLDTPWETE